MAYDEKLLALISCCVDCGFKEMLRRENGWHCPSCARDYLFDEYGVLDARPRKSVYESPEIYRTEFFRKWLRVWDDMVSDWIIYKNRFYRFLSMNGHFRIKKFIDSTQTREEPVVDLGCGNGQFFSIFPSDRQIIGIDANLAGLRIMKKKFPGALAIHGDMLRTPFRDGALKCVTSIHTLEHIYFLAESLQEIRRVLSENGKFYFCIPTEGGGGWELGRKLITGPFLRKKYKLNIKEVMAIEHINDAKRVLKFIDFYFQRQNTTYLPLHFLPFISINSSINGMAIKRVM